MESWQIVFLVVLAYLFASLAVGLYSGGRTSAGSEGYVAGDRSLNLLVLYFVLGASIYSAFAFLGGPGWAYSRGAAAFYMVSYGTVGLLPWYFFGPRVALLGRRFGYVTQAELLAHRFQSPFLSAFLALISLAAFIPYLTLQMRGAGYVFSVVTEGRMPIWTGAAAAYGVVLIYVFRSGVLAVAWTNTFQGILMLALAWGLGIYLPFRLYGGVGAMFERLAEVHPEMLIPPGLGAGGEAWSWGAYSSSVAVSALGFCVWPHFFMKIFTAKSIRTLKQSVVLYPTFQLSVIPILLIGFCGILKFPGVEPADTILPTIITSMQIPAIVVGLFCAGALAASMSTGDALLHASGSVVIKDFYRVLLRPDLSDSDQTRLIRLSVILIGGLAYALAVVSDVSLVYLLLLAYGAIVQVVPALFTTFFWGRATGTGVLAGLVVGSLVTLAWNLFPVLQWHGIHPGVWGLSANVVVLILVSLVTPRMEEEHVRSFIVE
jgi:SSS family solute:Na+ symporter